MSSSSSSLSTNNANLTPNAVKELLLGTVVKSNSNNATSASNNTVVTRPVDLPCRIKVTQIRPIQKPPAAATASNDSTKNVIVIDDDDDIMNDNDFMNVNNKVSTIVSLGFYQCQIDDGIYSEKALIYIHNNINNTILYDHNGNYMDMIIQVDGYISSQSNYMSRTNKQGMMIQSDPFLCITSFTLVQLCPDSTNVATAATVGTRKKKHNNNGRGSRKKVPSPPTVRGLKFGSFMKDQLPFFTHEDMIGISLPPTHGTTNTGNNHDTAIGMDGMNGSIVLLGNTKFTNINDIQKVADFIAHHKAKMILSFQQQRSQQQQRQQSNLLPFDRNNITTFTSSTTTASSLSSKNNDNHYIQALSSFVPSQLNRQIASLVTNAGREDKQTSELIVSQHSKALERAILHATFDSEQHQQQQQQSLTKNVLCQWHRIIGANGRIVPNAGEIRKKQVRAGSTVFPHFNSVEEELDLFCMELQSLEKKILHHSNQILSSSTTAATAANIMTQQHLKYYGLGPILFASVALYGIVDLHPFNDGNGRLGRIVANWALHRGGLPFVINICATPIQRAEYITAIELTRRNIGLQSHGQTPCEIFSLIQQGIGIFKPMFDMILDRVCRAIDQCQSIIQEKIERSVEEMESKAARKYLEKASRGTCLICFDDKPNIATLCCGRAVHINCIAQWLSSNNTCPNCRGELPTLERQATLTNVSNGGANASDMDSTTSSMDFSDPDETTTFHVEDVDSTTEDTTEEDQDDTTSIVDDDPPQHEDTTTYDAPPSPDDENDDTTSVVESTTEFSTTDDTTSAQPVQSHGAMYCCIGSCNNRAAVDCIHGCCGRCCVITYGFCPRHSNY